MIGRMLLHLLGKKWWISVKHTGDWRNTCQGSCRVCADGQSAITATHELTQRMLQALERAGVTGADGMRASGSA